MQYSLKKKNWTSSGFLSKAKKKWQTILYI